MATCSNLTPRAQEMYPIIDLSDGEARQGNMSPTTMRLLRRHAVSKKEFRFPPFNGGCNNIDKPNLWQKRDRENQNHKMIPGKIQFPIPSLRFVLGSQKQLHLHFPIA